MPEENDYTSLPEPQSAKFTGTFAYRTIKDRLPQILTTTIDSLHRRNGDIKAEHGEEGLAQLNGAISTLSQLRYEIMTNKPIKALSENGYSDTTLWNNWFKSKKEENENFSWFSGPWLGVECYMYRVIYGGFISHAAIKDIDPFGEAKLANLTASLGALENIVSWYEKTMLSDGIHTSKIEDFDMLLQLSLWGNRCDLSLSAGAKCSTTDTHISPDEEIQLLKPYLLVDDCPKVWNWLSSGNPSKTASKRIDVVIDNSGLELVLDLVLIDWLLHQNNADGSPLLESIVIHAKAFPWFVSDTTPADFHFTLSWLKDRTTFEGLATRLGQMVNKGKLKVETHQFWTSPYDFWRMKEIAPDLLEYLSSSHMIIFKGDLNGRKMFADLRWPNTTPFLEAVAPLTKLFKFSQSGTTALCLARTLKSELAMGLAADVVSRLNNENPDWSYSGKFAEIQVAIP